MEQITCSNCGNELPKSRPMKHRSGVLFCKHVKHCPDCNPYSEDDPKYGIWASSMANTYPERVNVLYECPCDDANKKKHHFDYKYPYDVFLLCQRCHMEEHKKVNRLVKFYQNKAN